MEAARPRRETVGVGAVADRRRDREKEVSDRCTPRKHYADKGQSVCDCGALMLGKTAAGNARIITVLDPVQLNALRMMSQK